MIINHNMNALNAHRQMSTNTVNSGKSMEKLSSGLRINRAGDDAAGLAISEKMRAQVRGLDQASRNSQDGISMIQTAEGALNETHSILQRMRELATQAANDTNTADDRGQIQNEINQLTSEINRIGNTTEFNTQKLLDGGEAAKAEKAASLPTVSVSATTAYASGTVGVFELSSTDVTAAMKIDGVDIAASAGRTMTGLVATITADATLGAKYTATTDGTKITLTQKVASSSGVTASGAATVTATTTGTDATKAVFEFTAKVPADGQKYTVDGKELTTTGSDATAVAESLKKAIEEDTDLKDKYEVTLSGDKLTLTQKTASATAAAVSLKSTDTTSGFSATLQIGANKGQAITIEVNDMRANALNISKSDVTQAPTVTATTAYASGTVGVFELSSTDVTAAMKIDGVDIAASAGRTMTGLVATITADATLGAKYTATTDGTKITLTQKVASSSGVTASGAATVTATTTGTDATKAVFEFTASPLKTGEKYTLDGKELSVTGTTAGDVATSLKDAISKDTDLKDKYDVTVTDSKVTLTQKTASATAAQLKVVGTDTDTGASFTAIAGVSNGTDNTNTEYALDVSSHEKATNAIKVLNDAINTVSTERSKLGGFQNRLEHTINNLGTSSENLTAAESRIRDVDMAKEMMTFSKNNILSQAAQAMLAQANQQPQGVLQLLR